MKIDAKKNNDPTRLSEFLKNVVNKLYEQRNKSLGEKQARDIEKFVSLSVIDTLWIQHLDSLDDLREGIGLRAAGQRDTLVEYKQEAYSMFEKLLASIDYDIVHRIFKVQVRREPAIEKLRNLRKYMPGLDETVYKFGAFLADRLNPRLVPTGFNLATELAFYDLQMVLMDIRENLFIVHWQFYLK